MKWRSLEVLHLFAHSKCISAVGPWLLAVALLCAPATLAQNDSAFDGVVTTESGQPIAEVSVTGSRSKIFPFKSESTTTKEDGSFHLDHPGSVVHFFHGDYEPRSLLVGARETSVRIMLARPSDDLVMPDCAKPPPDQRRIGWGSSGLQFSVPRRGVKISGGKPDVDYNVYVVRLKDSGSHLELWFGPYAMNLDPDDAQLVNSSRFSQRRVVHADGGFEGVDSRGQLRDGQLWRQTSVVAEGAKYQVARQQDAEVFDQIINSLCWVPYPK